MEFERQDLTPIKPSYLAVSPETLNAFKQDLLCGSFAGLMVCLSGHPLDSIKVRMQSSKVPVGLGSMISQTFKQEGVRGFYKGMSAPLVTVPLINSIVFASYEFCKRQLGVVNQDDFTFQQSMISGMFAGLVNSFVLSPIELVKCRLQLQREAKGQGYYKGSYDCLKKIVREEGLRNGLFKGMLSTIFREVPCYAGQFGSYFVAKKLLASVRGINESELGHIDQFIAGGTGGFFCWFFSYPQDIIKTRLQVSRSNEYPKYEVKGFKIPDGGIMNCSAEIYRTEGFKGFWQGFSACSSRAIIANSLMFMTYEFAQKRFDSMQE